MNFDRILNIIGLSLLGLCFAVSLWRVLTFTKNEYDTSTTEIRFAHYYLEGGVREAFDQLAEDYASIQRNRGRDVRIIQIAVPLRIYPIWLKTKLVGGTAPEIIAFGGGTGETRHIKARYFLPLRNEIEEPNPYNEGTHLEGVPWRSTFLDGLQESGFDGALLENFGVPTSTQTIRIYYNDSLIREIIAHFKNLSFGSELPSPSDPRPQNFEQFIGLCKAIQVYAREFNKTLVPIAGSKVNAPLVLEPLFQSQTQKMMFNLEPFYDYGGRPLVVGAQNLLGEWSFNDTHMRRGFSILREVSLFMQPGFIQASREDATFLFVQGRAAMICASSYDYRSILMQINNSFDIGVFPVPFPDHQNSRYGEHVLGPIAEGVTQESVLGLINYHPERKLQIALDFLRYLTSVQSSRKFSDISGWLPSNVGVEIPVEARPFEPQLAGYRPTPSYLRLGSVNATGVIESNLYRLIHPKGSVDVFITAIRDEFKRAAFDDIKIQENLAMKGSIQVKDTLIGANFWLWQNATSAAVRNQSKEKLDIIVETQGEFNGYHRSFCMQRLE